MVVFHIVVTPGSNAPVTLVTALIANHGPFNLTPDQDDHVGDHLVTVELRYSDGIVAKQIVSFTVQYLLDETVCTNLLAQLTYTYAGISEGEIRQLIREETLSTGVATASSTSLHYDDCMAMVTFQVDATSGTNAPVALLTPQIDAFDGAAHMKPE